MALVTELHLCGALTGGGPPYGMCDHGMVADTLNQTKSNQMYLSHTHG